MALRLIVNAFIKALIFTLYFFIIILINSVVRPVESIMHLLFGLSCRLIMLWLQFWLQSQRNLHRTLFIVTCAFVAILMVLDSFCLQAVCARVPTLLESPGFFGVQFPGPGKSWKMGLVLESPGNLSARSWKVLEFSRL